MELWRRAREKLFSRGDAFVNVVEAAKERKINKRRFYKIVIRYLLIGLCVGLVCRMFQLQEEVFLVAFGLLTSFALILIASMPDIRQVGDGEHTYADTRCWFGGCCGGPRIPNTSDVLSNLPFLWVGFETLSALAVLSETGVKVAGDSSGKRVHMSPTEVYGWTAVGLGWCAVCFGSSWYHIVLDDRSLAGDRAPIAIIVLGFACIAVEERLCEIPPAVVLTLLAIGVGSVAYWYFAGQAKSYYTTQYFGFAVTAILVISRPATYTLDYLWAYGVVGYVLAKILEDMDEPVYQWTGRVVSGHTLKHLMAAYGGHLVAHMLMHREYQPHPPTSQLANHVGMILCGLVIGIAMLGAVRILKSG